MNPSEEVGKPRVWDGAEIPITTVVARCPRGERAGMALPDLLHPWKADGNIWVCSSSTRPVQLCSLRENSRQRDHQPQGSCPCLGEVGLEDGGKGWQIQHLEDSFSSAPSPPKTDGEGFCLALRTEPTSPQLPGQTLWLHLPKAVYFITTRLRAESPVNTTPSDGKSAISHPPTAGWS